MRIIRIKFSWHHLQKFGEFILLQVRSWKSSLLHASLFVCGCSVCLLWRVCLQSACFGWTLAFCSDRGDPYTLCLDLFVCLWISYIYLSQAWLYFFANFVMSLFLLTTFRQFFFFYCLMVYQSFLILLVIISIYDSAYLELRWLFCRFATMK